MAKERKKMRIKINDLPKDKKISREEMKKVMGGKWWSIFTAPIGGGGGCDQGHGAGGGGGIRG